jgi:hypothetical protein
MHVILYFKTLHLLYLQNVILKWLIKTTIIIEDLLASVPESTKTMNASNLNFHFKSMTINLIVRMMQTKAQY